MLWGPEVMRLCDSGLLAESSNAQGATAGS